MNDLALIVFVGIVVALYLVSDHMSSKPCVNETERGIIERMVGMNKAALNLDCALMMACDRLGQYGGCPKYGGFDVSNEKRDSCEWADDECGYCSYTECWRRHLMGLAAKVR